MKNNCFIDNNFISQAPVLVFDDAPIDIMNNFGTFDDDVKCQFIAEYPSNVARERPENALCADYDAESCSTATALQAVASSTSQILI